MATMFLLCTVLLPLPKCVDEVHHVLRLCRLAVQIAEVLNEIDVPIARSPTAAGASSCAVEFVQRRLWQPSSWKGTWGWRVEALAR